MGTRFDDDVQFAGTVRFAKAPVMPTAGAVGNNQANPADPFKADKSYLRVKARLAQPKSAATAEERAVHQAEAAGSLVSFKCGAAVAAVGDSTVTFDLLKNGVSVLSGTVTLTSVTAAFALLSGSFSPVAYVAGDVFSIKVTISAGTGTLPQGVFAAATLDEQPS